MSRPSLGTLRTLAAWALVVLVGLSTLDARGEDLHGAMDRFAGRIKELLDDSRESSIAVNQFNAPARLSANASSGIRKALEEALVRRGVQIKKGARLEINGDYREVEDPATRKTVVRV